MAVHIEERDWESLAGMGSGAEAGLKAAGIDDFGAAVNACAELQSSGAASGAEYKPDDLICFLCLSQHAEAVSNPEMPPPAGLVSIEEDLGLTTPPPEIWVWTPPGQVCQRLKHKTRIVFDNPSEAQAAPPAAAPEGSAVQPLKKAKRWKANSLVQPLAQPTTSVPFPKACIVGTFYMLLCLPIGSAAALTQSCRSLYGDGRYIPQRFAASYHRVATLIADHLPRPGQVTALEKAGVPRGTLFRAVAWAMDLLDKCPAAFICDCSLLPLAMLRLGFKFEGVDKQVDTALKLLQPVVASRKPALLVFECRLVEALWGEGGLADGVGCPSQPLAR